MDPKLTGWLQHTSRDQMRTFFVAALALLAACDGDPRRAPPLFMAVEDASFDLATSAAPAGDLGDTADQLTVPADDAATSPDAASASDLAACGLAGAPCCDSQQYDPTYCPDTRAGSECSGTCSTGEVCRRDFNAVSYGVPTCYACGAGEHCCAGDVCPPSYACESAGAGAFNTECSP